MAVIQVTDRNGQRHEVDAELDMPIMESLKRADLPVAADCGGCAACGTCHVYVDATWAERLESADLMEDMMLGQSAFFREGASRLSCQLAMTPELEGLELTLAPND